MPSNSLFLEFTRYTDEETRTKYIELCETIFGRIKLLTRRIEQVCPFKRYLEIFIDLIRQTRIRNKCIINKAQVQRCRDKLLEVFTSVLTNTCQRQISNIKVDLTIGRVIGESRQVSRRNKALSNAYDFATVKRYSLTKLTIFKFKI